jgi:hypothetical protein
MGDNVTSSPRAAKVALLSDLKRLINVNEPNAAVICWNQVAHVLSVRQYQEFPIWVRLRLVTLDRFRQPLTSILGEAQARHEREAARLPLEPQELSLLFRIALAVRSVSGSCPLSGVALQYRRPVQIPDHRPLPRIRRGVAAYCRWLSCGKMPGPPWLSRPGLVEVNRENYGLVVNVPVMYDAGRFVTRTSRFSARTAIRFFTK